MVLDNAGDNAQVRPSCRRARAAWCCDQPPPRASPRQRPHRDQPTIRTAFPAQSRRPVKCRAAAGSCAGAASPSALPRSARTATASSPAPSPAAIGRWPVQPSPVSARSRTVRGCGPLVRPRSRSLIVRMPRSDFSASSSRLIGAPERAAGIRPPATRGLRSAFIASSPRAAVSRSARPRHILAHPAERPYIGLILAHPHGQGHPVTATARI